MMFKNIAILIITFCFTSIALFSCSVSSENNDESRSANESKVSESSAAETTSEGKNTDDENEAELPGIIDQVIEQEKEWLEVINKQDEAYNYYNIPAAGGDDYIWFQDMDMDGQPDFVTLSKYMPGTDVGTFRAFNIYTNDKGNLISHFSESSSFSESGLIYSDGNGFEDDSFDFTLWKSANGKYHYLSDGVNGNIVLGQISELVINNNVTKLNNIITVLDENTQYKGCEINANSESVMYAEGIQYYENYFAALSPCDTTVKKIKLSEYTSLSNDEKIKLLTDSYNAWSCSENGISEKPLSNVIESIRKEINKAGNENDYADVLDYFYNNINGSWSNIDYNSDYGLDNSNFANQKVVSYMWKRYYSDKSLSDAGYVLIDLNGDGVKELLVAVLDEYGSQILDIFTLNSGNIIHLAATGERDRFIFCNDNVIEESGSSGAAHSSTKYYRLENAVLTPIEEYEADGDTDPNSPYYYADKFKFETSQYSDYGYFTSTNRKNISEKEFNNRKYKENSGIFTNVIPFNRYSPKTIINNTPSSNETVLFTGYVNTEKDPLNVRKSPSTNADVLGKIDKGTPIDIYGESGDWYEIRYNGQVGYVSKQFVLCGDGFGKPVIYLYPEKKTDVSVKVKFKNGYFACTYPEYNNGWNVTAYPDGKIINKADNDEYSYLYWEGEGFSDSNFDTGFVVKREDTAKFLKEKLSYMGLTPKEYNEFIVYWLPIMQKNEYNLVSFQMENYDNSAKLDVTPTPDSMLRVFMAFKKADSNSIVPEQKLERFERKGFTVIEWGGTEIK